MMRSGLKEVATEHARRKRIVADKELEVEVQESLFRACPLKGKESYGRASP
jgi:hypothetical protein